MNERMTGCTHAAKMGYPLPTFFRDTFPPALQGGPPVHIFQMDKLRLGANHGSTCWRADWNTGGLVHRKLQAEGLELRGPGWGRGKLELDLKPAGPRGPAPDRRPVKERGPAEEYIEWGPGQTKGESGERWGRGRRSGEEQAVSVA